MTGARPTSRVLRWRHRLSATYSLGGWAVTLAQNDYAGYRTNDRPFDAAKNLIRAQSIFDAQLAYTGIRDLGWRWA